MVQNERLRTISFEEQTSFVAAALGGLLHGCLRLICAVPRLLSSGGVNLYGNKSLLFQAFEFLQKFDMPPVMLFDEYEHETTCLISTPIRDLTGVRLRVVWRLFAQFPARNRSRFVGGHLQYRHRFVIGQRCNSFVLDVFGVLKRHSAGPACLRQKL